MYIIETYIIIKFKDIFYNLTHKTKWKKSKERKKKKNLEFEFDLANFDFSAVPMMFHF